MNTIERGFPLAFPSSCISKITLSAGSNTDADKKRYVFSSKPGEKKDNIEFISDMLNFPKNLAESLGKDIWHATIQIVRSKCCVVPV